MKRTIVLLGMLCVAQLTKAQDGHIQWQKTYGGTLMDYPHQIARNHSGGYIVCGTSLSGVSASKTDTNRGSYDMWLLNLDMNGQVIWDKTIGAGLSDHGFSVIPTSDGGYLVAGDRSMNWEEAQYPAYPGSAGDAEDTVRGSRDCWVLKLDASGGIEWQKTMGGFEYESAWEVKEMEDGYVILCNSDSDVHAEKADSCRDIDPCLGCPIGDLWLLKLGLNGNILWQRTIGGDRGDVPGDMLITGSGKIIIGANSYSRQSGEKSEPCRDDFTGQGVSDFWVLAIDGSNGTILWQKTIGGNRTDELRSIVETEDGHYMLAGWSTSDSTGEKNSRSLDSLYMAENFYLNGGDFWLVTIDTMGTLVDQKIIGGDKEDKLTKLVAIPGGYYAVGWSNSGVSFDKTDSCRGETSGMFILWPDVWILKLDAGLNILWQKTIGCSLDDYAIDAVYDDVDSSLVLLAASNSPACTDKTAANLGSYDYWVMKISENGTTGIAGTGRRQQSLTVFPNPATETLHVLLPEKVQSGTLWVYDMMGRAVYNAAFKSTHPEISLHDFADGQYWLRLYDGKETYHQRFSVWKP